MNTHTLHLPPKDRRLPSLEDSIAGGDDPHLSALAQQLHRHEKRDANAQLAHHLALAEFINALDAGPLAMVSAPNDAQLPLAAALFEACGMRDVIDALRRSIHLAVLARGAIDAAELLRVNREAHSFLGELAAIYATGFVRSLTETGAFEE